MRQTQSYNKYLKLKNLFHRKSTLLALLCGVFMMALISTAMAQAAGELDTAFAPALANYEADGIITNDFTISQTEKFWSPACSPSLATRVG